MLSVVHGVSAGKKGSMGGECDGNLRQIILKARALCGQGVDQVVIGPVVCQ